MKKWSAAVFLSAVVGVFAGSGYACCSSIGLFDVDEEMIIPVKYITVLNSTPEGGSFTGGGEVKVGETIRLTATHAEGYEFVGWFDKDGNLVSEKKDYDVLVSKDVTYYARFRPVNLKTEKYTLTLSNEKYGGTAIAGTVQGGGKFLTGTTVKIKAEHFTGYTFAGWYDGETKLSDDPQYDYTITKDTTLTAKWDRASYLISTTKNIDEAGEAYAYESDELTSYSFTHGSTATLTAKTNAAYEFMGWYDGETLKSTSAVYKFTVVEGKTYEAKWAKKTYTIAAHSAETEKGTVSGANVYEHGASVTLTATAKSGYTFAGWYNKAGVKVSDKASFTFNATKNVEYTARWDVEAVYYDLALKNYIDDEEVTGQTVEAGTATGSGSYESGEKATLAATPNEGYEFVGWYEADAQTLISIDAEYEYTVNGDVTIVAKWAKKKYTIAVSQNMENAGSISGVVLGNNTYQHGAQVSLEAEPAVGHEFVGWYFDGEPKSTALEYNFVATAAVSIEARWKAIEYQITVNSDLGDAAGTITGATKYTYGATAELTATANPRYKFLGWFDGETEKSTNATYTFTVTGEVTLIAKWEISQYEVKLENSNATAGEINTQTTIVVNKGETTTLTATPNTGYEFLGWYDPFGRQISTDLTYEYEPESDITLTAKWKISDDAAFDSTQLDMNSITGYVSTTSAEVGERADIPVVKIKYAGIEMRAFPWVTKQNGESVPVGSRGTKFLVEENKPYTIDYYIQVGVGAPYKIATTAVEVFDTQGPTWKLPASADGMLVYKNQEITLPDWTAYDPSGIFDANNDGVADENDVTVSVTYNGSPVSINGDKFTPTNYGSYKVRYEARDNSTNQNVEDIEFTIECKRMVEICNFDTEGVADAYAYTTSTSTLGELSTEFRYGDSGYSLKFSGVGTGADGIIKTYAIPNFYDLSGFDEIALYVWSDQDLTSTSTGIYLLNNEGYSGVPINLKAGENIVKFSKEGFQASYPGGLILNNDKNFRVDYRNEDYIWFQFRAPAGCNIYMDNLVGIFNDYTGSDEVAPIVDLGSAPLRAATTDADGKLYDGAYGDITCWTGETLKAAVDRVLHAYDNSGDAPTTYYKVTTEAGADVTASVKDGTIVGVEGTKYNITAWAIDGDGVNGNKSAEKTGTILVRNKPIEHTMTGHDKRTLSLFNQEGLVTITDQDFATLSMDYKINKNGRLKVKTHKKLGDVYLNLKMPEGNYLTTEDINKMKYINVRIFTYNVGAEMYVGNTLITRLRAGWNDFSFDAQLLLQSGVYDSTTGMAKLQVFSPLANSIELIFESAAAIYEAGQAPGEELLPPLDNPVVTIDGTTGIASWEAVENATGYIYSINNGDEVEVEANVLSVQLSDGEEFKVRAKGDGVNYSDSAMTANQLYLDGADLLHGCEDSGFNVFESQGTITTSTEHVKQGTKSVKVVFSAAGYFVPCLKKGNNALTLESLQNYEYIEFNVYSDTADIFLLCGSGTSGNATIVPNATLVQGDNTIRLTREYLLNQINLDGTAAFNPANGALTLHTSGACTLYFDKFIGKLDPNVGKTTLLSPRVTVDETGLATWTEVANATGYVYRINGGEEVTVLDTTQRSVRLGQIGDTIQVRSLGDGETYLDSVYSIVHEWLDPNASEVLLNKCESVAGWVEAANTPALSTANVHEGTHSVEATGAADGWWINVRILETSPTLAELQATYETIKFNVYSSYATQNRLWLGDAQGNTLQEQIQDMEARTVALLNNGANVVEIPTSALDSTKYVETADGAFLSFRVGGACTLHIDNVIGVKQGATTATALSAPSVTISETGVASWTAVTGASGYVCKIAGAEQAMTTATSVQLTSGQTIQVKAVGDGTTYTDSAYSAVQTYTATSTASQTVLNDCELAVTGAFEVSGASIELSTAHVTQGTHSVKMTTTAGWAPTLIYLKKNGAPLTRDDIAAFDYIEMTIYAEQSTDFYFYNHLMGWLEAGQSTTLRISSADFLAQVDGGNKGTVFDPYSYSVGYAFFQVASANVTLYFDNVVGVTE